MPDYAACYNVECTRRADCCRYRMVPSPYRQSYVVVEGPGDDCDLYWPVSEGAPFKLFTPEDADRENRGTA